MKWVDLNKCFVCEQKDKTVYLTSLEVGADVFTTYGDDYKVSKVIDFFEKDSMSYSSEVIANNMYAEFVVANNTYIVLF